MAAGRMCSLALLAAASIAACCLVGPAVADSEFAICTASPSIQWMPAASGTRIVWVDQRSGGNDIYMYDMATHTEQAICTASGDQMWPEIDGDRIVWMDQRSGSWAVFLYDLAAHAERKLADAPIPSADGIWYTQGPDISGDYVVWSDHRNGNMDVLFYDLSTSQLAQVTHGSADHGLQGPRIHGNRIVWCDLRDGVDGDVYAYDISTQQETLIAGGPVSQGQPDTWGDIVVWTQAAGDSFGIWYVDLVAGIPSPLVDAPYTQDHARVTGRWVVWSDDRNGGGDTTKDEVYAYDLGDHTERPLTASPHPYGNLGPTIADTGIVAWMDFRNGDRPAYTNPDIYGYVLPMFADVLATNWSFDSVEACASAGIVSGYPDGTYQPSVPVTRDQMAVFLVRALGQEPANPIAPQSWKDAYGYDLAVPATWAVDFTDVPASGWGDPEGPYWAWFHIQRLYETGVTQGVTATEYGPAQEVSRDQMAVFLIRALGSECANPCVDTTCWPYDPANPSTWAHDFADIPATGQDTCHGAHWAWYHIQALYETGVTLGCGDGANYCPGDSVRRDEMAVFLARAFLGM